MWNPFKTLSERDSARLRSVEHRLREVEDDVEQCLRTGERINARLRARARRAGAASEGDAGESGNDSAGDFHRDANSHVGLQVVGNEETGTQIKPPKFTKDQLREFARARGIRG